MSTSAPSRRGLLGAIAALPLAAIPAAAALNPDAELIALCREFMVVAAALDECDSTPDGWPEERCDAMVDRWCKLIRRIEPMRALTPAGVRAKAEVGYKALLSIARNGALPGAEEEVAFAALADMLGVEHEYMYEAEET